MGAGLGELCQVMFNRSIVTVPIPSLSFPDSGHTFVSCPHLVRPCPHSTPWPKSDSPNMASSSNAGTGGKSASRSGLSAAPTALIPIPWAGSSVPYARDPAAHSIPQLHNPQNRILPGSLLPLPSLPLPSKSGIGTWEPIQHGTDSAISYVITFEICSLLPPCASMLSATTPRKDSSERPFRPFPSGTGLASPLSPTHRVGISTFH